MNNSSHAIPKWFTVTTLLTLIWNLMGVMAFFAQITMSSSDIAALPQAEQYLYNNTPLWATMAFACAVFAGALGSFFLFLKKRLAQPLLILSLCGVMVQMFHSFVISNSFEVFGPGGAIMPVMVVLISITLVRISITAKNKGWLQ